MAVFTFNETDDFSSLSDDELCELIKNGNEEAFDQLVIRYIPILRAKSSFHIRFGLEAEDLFQEALLALHNAAKSYNSKAGATFKTFASICIDRSLFSICKSALCKKRLPHSKILSLSLLNDYSGINKLAISDSNIDPEQIIIDKEQLRSRKDFIRNKLTNLEYNALLLYIGGASYDNIAKKLSISFKSVDNALQRCRKKLKKFIYR